MQRYKLPVLLGLAHGVSDGSAGLLLGSLAHLMPLSEVGILVLLYNLLAFGAQPVAGLLVDRLQQPQRTAVAGLLLNAAALLALQVKPSLAIVLAGVGSALFHVGGGGLALCVMPGRATAPGIFAAPGVFGLAIGGALAVTGNLTVWPFLMLLMLLVAAIAWQPLPALPYPKFATNGALAHDPLLETHDVVMMVLLIAISLRSAVWTTFQFILDGQTEILIWLAIVAALGKILGGLLADYVGWRRWAVGALMAAAPILAFSGENAAALLLGVGLLQSATPGMVAAMAQAMPRAPATAAGLAFGLAIVIGAIPVVSGLAAWMNSPPFLFAMSLAAGFLLWQAVRLQSDALFTEAKR